MGVVITHYGFSFLESDRELLFFLFFVFFFSLLSLSALKSEKTFNVGTLKHFCLSAGYTQSNIADIFAVQNLKMSKG